MYFKLRSFFLEVVSYSGVSGHETDGIFLFNNKVKDAWCNNFQKNCSYLVFPFSKSMKLTIWLGKSILFFFYFETSKTMQMHLTNAGRLECT